MNAISSSPQDVLRPSQIDLQQIEQRDALIRVRKTWKTQETDEERYVKIRPFVTNPAQVTISIGRTLNLGNYESAKLNLSVTYPCYKEEISEMVSTIYEFVLKEFEERVEDLQNRIHVQTSARKDLL